MPQTTGSKNTLSKKLLICLSSAAFIAAAGCANLQLKSTADDQASTLTASDSSAGAGAEQAAVNIEAQNQEPQPSLAAETLYDLLLAELASKKNRLDVTLGNYQKQAKRTEDPAVIRRYMRIAKYMKAHQATLDASTLMLAIAPNDHEALQTASIELIRLKQFKPAIDHIDTLLTNNNDVNFEFFLLHARQAPESSRPELIASIKLLLEDHPNNAKLWFTYALLLDQSKDYTAALAANSTSQELDPNYIPAIISQSKILNTMGDTKGAIKTIKRGVKQHPDNQRLRLVYLQVLLEQKDAKEAKQQLNLLASEGTDNPSLELRLALLAWEHELNQSAKKILLRLIDNKQSVEEARSYIARIYVSEDNIDGAIAQLALIPTGTYFSTAQIRLAALLIQQDKPVAAQELLQAARLKQPKSAAKFYAAEGEILVDQDKLSDSWNLLSEAITRYPKSTELLYSRAMLAEKLDRMDTLEGDLKSILSFEPNSALALNALGYTLADRTDRFDEALGFIEQAYKLKPNDAAIVDSLGWVNYRLGNYERATFYLRQAYELNDDAEIAMHLCEVLWLHGNKAEARTLFKTTQQKYPDSKYVTEFKERFNIDL